MPSQNRIKLTYQHRIVIKVKIVGHSEHNEHRPTQSGSGRTLLCRVSRPRPEAPREIRLLANDPKRHVSGRKVRYLKVHYVDKNAP